MKRDRITSLRISAYLAGYADNDKTMRVESDQAAERAFTYAQDFSHDLDDDWSGMTGEGTTTDPFPGSLERIVSRQVSRREICGSLMQDLTRHYVQGHADHLLVTYADTWDTTTYLNVRGAVEAAHNRALFAELADHTVRLAASAGCSADLPDLRLLP